MRGFGSLTSRVCATLCSLLFAATAFAGDVHVFTIDSPAWSTNLNIAAPDGAVAMRVSNCGSVSAYNRNLEQLASRAELGFTASQCNAPDTKKLFDGDGNAFDTLIRMWVVTLPVTSGAPRVASTANYATKASFNTIRIPSLPDALPAGSPKAYWFYGIESYAKNDAALIPSSKSAQIILVAESQAPFHQARARVTYYDQDGVEIPAASTIVNVSTWETLNVPVSASTRTYTVRVESLPLNQFGMTPTGLYAIAASYDARGGGPSIDTPATQ
jgi:hypothetical protein